VSEGLFKSIVAFVSADTGITSRSPASIRMQMRDSRLGIFINNMWG